MKGVRSGVERRRGVSGLMKARDPGRRDAPGDKVLKERRSPRERGRMVTSEGRPRLALTSLELRPSRSVASTPRPIAGPSSAHVATAFAPSVPRTTPSAPGTSRKMVTSLASTSARKTELIFERGSEEGEAGAGGVNGVNDASVSRGLKPRGGRRDRPGKILKDRRPPRERGRMGRSRAPHLSRRPARTAGIS